MANYTVPIVLQVLGCDASHQPDLSAQLQSLGSSPAVVLLCTRIDSSITGSAAGLAAELQQLCEAHSAVAALNKRQITLYAPRPDAADILQQRRLLQAANTDVGTCGQLCQVSGGTLSWLRIYRICAALTGGSWLCVDSVTDKLTACNAGVGAPGLIHNAFAGTLLALATSVYSTCPVVHRLGLRDHLSDSMLPSVVDVDPSQVAGGNFGGAPYGSSCLLW